MRRLIFVSIALAINAISGAAWAANLPSCRDAWSSSGLVRSNGHKFSYESKDTYADWLKRTQRSKCSKDWTVLVYMSADNDLAPYALWDLYEMEAGYQATPTGAGSTIGNDLVVQLDSAGPTGLRRYHVFQTPEVFTQKQKSDFDGRDERIVRSPVVETLPERDGKNEARRFQEFLDWAVKNYPSQRYMVVVWGHGRGWVTKKSPARLTQLKGGNVLEPADLDENKDGATENAEPLAGRLAFNQSSGQFLDIPALKASLSRMSRAIGKPVDVYASDACLMQMVEVANELAPNARYIVGSAQIQRFLGLPYRRIMHELNSGRFGGLRAQDARADESELLARMIPKVFRESMNPRLGSQGKADPKGIRSLTSSALDSAKLQRTLAPALESLGAALAAYLAEDRLRVMDLQFIAQKTPGYEGGAQDLGVFLAHVQTLLKKETQKTRATTEAAKALKAAITKTQRALDSAIANYSIGTEYDREQTGAASVGAGKRRGVSIWLPASEDDYKERRADFASSSFFKASPSWLVWLDALY